MEKRKSNRRHRENRLCDNYGNDALREEGISFLINDESISFKRSAFYSLRQYHFTLSILYSLERQVHITDISIKDITVENFY